MSLIELYDTNVEQLVRWVRETYLSQDQVNPHRARRKEIARRLRLYRDDYEQDARLLVRQVFNDSKVRKDREKLIDVSRMHNVTRRIIDEVASLYDKPALRLFDDVATQEAFRLVEERVELHDVYQEAHRLTYLCNEVLVWSFDGVDGNDLRVVTPDTFDAIPDPRDSLRPAGYLIDAAPVTMQTGAERRQLKHYEIWDDTMVIELDADGRMLGQPRLHGLGQIPGVLFHRRKPVDRILDERAGRDITSAHLGVLLLNIMIMRLSKAQGENQPVLRGNLANVAKGQSFDGETPIALPPEVVAEMLQMKTDPEHYLSVIRHLVTSIAQTYGMSYEQFTYQQTSSDASSGKAYTVRREKLTELRQEQRRRAKRHEVEVVKLLGFSTEGFRVDHQEQAIPQDAQEEVTLLDAKMRKGLDSPISYLMRKDPDLDRKRAQKLLLDNLIDWMWLISAVRALNAPADADAANPGQSPQQNGAANGGAANDSNPASGVTTRDPGTGMATAA
jgi:hypothetical protein